MVFGILGIFMVESQAGHFGHTGGFIIGVTLTIAIAPGI